MAAVLADLHLDRVQSTAPTAGTWRDVRHWLGPALLASLCMWAVIGLGIGAIVTALG